MIQQSPVWIFTQKNRKQDLEEIAAYSCSLQHFSQNGQEVEHPLTDEWMKNKWCICTVEYYLALKKSSPAICYNVDEP